MTSIGNILWLILGLIFWSFRLVFRLVLGFFLALVVIATAENIRRVVFEVGLLGFVNPFLVIIGSIIGLSVLVLVAFLVVKTEEFLL
jgi:hypothetical protein